jgi:hypothetical protein
VGSCHRARSRAQGFSSTLEFYKTARGFSTASSELVRQPINRDGLHQWRRYRRWLNPLEKALGDALVRYRDEPSVVASKA